VVSGLTQRFIVNMQINEATSYDSIWTSYIKEEYKYLSVGETFSSFSKESSNGRLLDIRVILYFH